MAGSPGYPKESKNTFALPWPLKNTTAALGIDAGFYATRKFLRNPEK